MCSPTFPTQRMEVVLEVNRKKGGKRKFLGKAHEINTSQLVPISGLMVSAPPVCMFKHTRLLWR